MLFHLNFTRKLLSLNHVPTVPLTLQFLKQTLAFPGGEAKFHISGALAKTIPAGYVAATTTPVTPGIFAQMSHITQISHHINHVIVSFMIVIYETIYICVQLKKTHHY